MPPSADTLTLPAMSQGLGSHLRSSNQQGNIKTRAADTATTICTRENAHNFLDKNRFLLKEDPLSTTPLATPHSTPTRMIQEGSRAVAILMMDEAARTIGTAVQQYIEKCLMPILNKLDNASDNLQTATQTAREATGEVNKAVGKATARKENEAYNAAANGGTYAAALKGNVPLSHLSNLAKANARNCQTLIDKDLHAEQNDLDTLTEQELVTKANEAMEQLGETLDIEDYTFMGVKKLMNDGVVFDMNTPNAVKMGTLIQTRFHGEVRWHSYHQRMHCLRNH